MADFGGGGGFIPPNPGPELEMMARAQQDEMKRRGGGHRPPKRPRGPRFGLLRRLVRLIRGGGD